MNQPKQLTTITTFSKLISGILFIALPFVGFYLGIQYQEVLNDTILLESDVIPQLTRSLPDTQKIFEPSVLIANPALYINKIVVVQAVAMPKNIACTLRDCGPSVACCNTCAGDLFLSNPSGSGGGSSMKDSIRLVGGHRGCSGMDCDLKCTPFEKGEVYVVTGKLIEKTNTSDQVYYELEYISHSPINPSATPPSIPNTKDSDTVLPIRSAENFKFNLSQKETFEKVFNEKSCETDSTFDFTNRVIWDCSKNQYRLVVRKFIQGLNVPKFCLLSESDILSKGHAWEVTYITIEDEVKYKIITNVDVVTGEVFCESKGIFPDS